MDRREEGPGDESYFQSLRYPCPAERVFIGHEALVALSVTFQNKNQDSTLDDLRDYRMKLTLWLEFYVGAGFGLLCALQ